MVAKCLLSVLRSVSKSDSHSIFASRREYSSVLHRRAVISILSIIMPLTQAAAQEIAQLIDCNNDQQDPKMVSKLDRVLAILEAGGELYYREIVPKSVGIDPSNRDQDLMSETAVHTRGSSISAAGFSRKIAEAEAVAMEDDPIERMVAKHTMKITSLSSKLATMQMEEIEVGSLGSGHCNQWLCCILDEVPCNIENLSEGGKMSKAKLFADAGTKSACERGLKWAVIRHPNRKMFPKLGSFIQSALNIKHHIGQGDCLSITNT